MHSKGKPPEAELAAALDVWVAARERAINELQTTAVTLEQAGQKKTLHASGRLPLTYGGR